MRDWLLSTECCKQRAHMSCLRQYYELLATSCTQDDRDKIAHVLGLPNCFVCRMEDQGMRPPLTRSVLDAILPEVDDTGKSGHDANLAMIRFK